MRKRGSALGSSSSTEGPTRADSASTGGDAFAGDADDSPEDDGSGGAAFAGDADDRSLSDGSGGAAAAGGSRGVAPPQNNLIARLGRPHGLDGFLGLYVEPEDLVYFDPRSVVFVRDDPYTVREVRHGKKGPQVAFEGVATREEAEAIRGMDVSVPEQRELGHDEFWPADLIGLEVRPLGGVVLAVEHGGAQDRLVIERSGDTFEVPFVHDLVPVVDIAEGFVEIVDLEGLSSPSDRG